MTYFGGERVVPGYNMMGVCKAALDAAVKYLAYDLGPQEDPGQRPVGRSGQDAGCLGRGRLRQARRAVRAVVAPGTQYHPRRGGAAGMFLLSDLATGISGEILHVDCGYNVMGSPGRAIERVKALVLEKVKAANPEVAALLEKDDEFKRL